MDIKAFNEVCDTGNTYLEGGHFGVYSGQKKKLSAPKQAKYFFPINLGQIFFAPVYYGWSFALHPKVTPRSVKLFNFNLGFANSTSDFKSCNPVGEESDMCSEKLSYKVHI